ncbi:MAG: 4Fe-4S dicluster domain-containing protein [candidate division WOR-3 bacterium]|nr:MAG: 4Fe-4S dicluster domain-containing protein [candidate division WOR-3 bacterium]
MSKECLMYKEDFEEFLARLIEGHSIFCPSGEDISPGIKKVAGREQFALHRGPSHFSFKHYFLPQTERLFSFDMASNKIDASNGELDDNKLVVLIGLRPCDAMAIELLDQVFLQRGPEDVFYARRRRRTRIISFACSEPRTTCFCESVGCGPDAAASADMVIFALKDSYIVKTITQCGEELLNNTGMNLDGVSTEKLGEREQMINESRDRLEKVFTSEDLNGKIMDFEASYWKQICQKCLGCGICTYFCPTCHCFDIVDEVAGSKGRRIRSWDSCMYPLFTLHASGHNPRPTRKERMRQRIMHKFVYSMEQYGRRFCVGCGRCVIHCPVNLDLRLVIKEIAEGK